MLIVNCSSALCYHILGSDQKEIFDHKTAFSSRRRHQLPVGVINVEMKIKKTLKT